MNGADSIVTGIAGRYANALFELAREAGTVDEVAEELEAIGALIDESADFRRLIASPTFSARQQQSALGVILERIGASETTTNFLLVAARNRRLFALPGMISAFARLVAESRGETPAEVISAHPLNATQQKSLAGALRQAIGKNVKLTTKVDPALLGGLVVRVGSRMIDTSLRTKLNSLRLAMKEVG